MTFGFFQIRIGGRRSRRHLSHRGGPSGEFIHTRQRPAAASLDLVSSSRSQESSAVAALFIGRSWVLRRERSTVLHRQLHAAAQPPTSGNATGFFKLRLPRALPWMAAWSSGRVCFGVRPISTVG
ncbi:unnamed protein product [Cuscuta epithymum]|uniref:Uncharacterized protein n=1 Tax=Cuscuta epithymum TaxID=186058 RepID=A0AAV0GGX3_9ASTE|nr:unnamed protein product [Cuscuta epithymum]